MWFHAVLARGVPLCAQLYHHSLFQFPPTFRCFFFWGQHQILKKKGSPSPGQMYTLLMKEIALSHKSDKGGIEGCLFQSKFRSLGHRIFAFCSSADLWWVSSDFSCSMITSAVSASIPFAKEMVALVGFVCLAFVALPWLLSLVHGDSADPYQLIYLAAVASIYSVMPGNR